MFGVVALTLQCNYKNNLLYEVKLSYVPLDITVRFWSTVFSFCPHKSDLSACVNSIIKKRLGLFTRVIHRQEASCWPAETLSILLCSMRHHSSSICFRIWLIIWDPELGGGSEFKKLSLIVKFYSELALTYRMLSWNFLFMEEQKKGNLH